MNLAPKTYTDPNTRLENFGVGTFSAVLTTWRNWVDGSLVSWAAPYPRMVRIAGRPQCRLSLALAADCSSPDLQWIPEAAHFRSGPLTKRREELMASAPRPRMVWGWIRGAPALPELSIRAGLPGSRREEGFVKTADAG